MKNEVPQLQYNAPAISHLNIPVPGWFNEYSHGITKAGLAYWSPTSKIGRAHRLGIGQDTNGEGLYLTTTMAKAFINGLKGYKPNLTIPHAVFDSSSHRQLYHKMALESIVSLKNHFLVWL